jgi:hypothetical protein
VVGTLSAPRQCTQQTRKRDFAYEVTLRVPTLTWLRGRWPEAVIGEEINLGWGSPDIVAAIPTRLAERISTGVPPLTRFEQIVLIDELERGPVSELPGSSLSAPRYEREILGPLLDHQLCRHTEWSWHRVEPFHRAVHEPPRRRTAKPCAKH